ncbi:MAG TPA: hypothetical protein VKU41_10555 [Polyangiaceae bacterium]|nr:hypothetical protein [Polyangiaceae bacterium]
MPRRLASLFVLFSIFLAACGGKGAAVGGESKPDLDADPLALLPASAVAIANVDAHALFASASLGPSLAPVADALLPVGADAGVVVSRDVDRIVVASYATGGIDLVAVLVGRFDPAKISGATKAKTGAAVVPGAYGKFTTYTVGPVTYVPMTAKTLVAGTGDAVRRLLDRVAQGKLERSMPPWQIETLQTAGAEVAIVADLASQGVASATIGSLSLPWVKAIKVARIIGNFEAPGMNFAATLTYADAPAAQSAADGVRTMGGWLKVLGPILGGASIQNLEATTAGADLQCKLSVDDQSLRTLLGLAVRFLPFAPQ